MDLMSNTVELEQWARALEDSGDYRVLRRLPIQEHFGAASANQTIQVLVVDTETTGTLFSDDALIEFSGLKVLCDAVTGQVVSITDHYSSLDDPKRPIPESSTAIHGITDDMVKGQCIDEPRVEALCQGVDLVIAHNAAFDRPFLERRLPFFKNLAFGCSHLQIPWSEEGFSGSKLEYLVSQCGYFYDAHRSEIDCRALVAVLAKALPRSGQYPIKFLLEHSRSGKTRVFATKAPFDSKDLLKARGYRWDAQQKVWHILIQSDRFKDEALWLKQEVYFGRSAEIQIELLDAKVLFSHRPGVRRTQVI